ncbi:hypothetical protein FJ251_01975 [bacterium]|nr:hypothetical protein [bacterium]
MRRRGCCWAWGGSARAGAAAPRLSRATARVRWSKRQVTAALSAAAGRRPVSNDSRSSGSGASRPPSSCQQASCPPAPARGSRPISLDPSRAGPFSLPLPPATGPKLNRTRGVQTPVCRSGLPCLCPRRARGTHAPHAAEQRRGHQQGVTMPFFAQGTGGLLGDLGGLISGATLLGKIVLAILFAMSVLSWALMVERGRRLGRATRGNARFWEQFLPAREDAGALRRLGAWAEQQREAPLAVVYHYFSREILPGAFGQANSPERLRTLGEVLARGVDRVATEEMGKLERGVSWLATFTSTAPFIGLLGTVYGILTSFLEIGRQGTASLDAVGPGIAESLVATVAGLAVAIPAAVAYNYFVGKLKQQDADLQALGAHLGDLLAREDLRLEAPAPAPVAGRALS